MYKYLSRLLIIVGVAILAYSGIALYQSKQNEEKRLEEAKLLVSDEIIEEVPEADYEFKTGETVGVFYIPRLNREIPIIEGTDEDELSQGVGHYAGTGFPGENKQILLSGHRDTVFRQFGELEHGDELHIKMEHGTFIYVIKDHEIVDTNDETVIDPKRKEEYLTVSTCYPFSIIGNAPDRYVLYAYPK